MRTLQPGRPLRHDGHGRGEVSQGDHGAHALL